jgi:hypothetical protein
MNCFHILQADLREMTTADSMPRIPVHHREMNRGFLEVAGGFIVVHCMVETGFVTVVETGFGKNELLTSLSNR